MVEDICKVGQVCSTNVTSKIIRNIGLLNVKRNRKRHVKAKTTLRFLSLLFAGVQSVGCIARSNSTKLALLLLVGFRMHVMLFELVSCALLLEKY